MKPTVRPLSCWFLAAALVAAVVGAVPATRAAEPPVFPSQVELVTVDAVVVDANGAAVPHLTRDDFAVLEGGVRQEIASFEAITVSARRDGASDGGPALQPVRVASNMTTPGERATFLVVVDDIHLSVASMAQARAALERFLRDSVRDGDRMTIVSTDTRGAWSGMLPADRADLAAFAGRLRGRMVVAGPERMTEYEAMRIAEYNDSQALERVMGRYYRYSECSTVSPCDARVTEEARAQHGHDKMLRETSLAVIERSLEGLARLRGRKSVVLLSEGFIHDDPQEPAYRRVVAAAQRTNAALYFVDMRGVVGLAPYAGADAPEDGEPTNPKLPNAAAGVMQNRIHNATELVGRSGLERGKSEQKIDVATIADDTGGFALRGTNDLGPGLERISSESRVYYLLGYYPTAASRDGGFRRIEVHLARAGLEVRARKGYDAPGPAGKDARKAARQEKPDPLVQAFEASAEVPLRLATYALEPLPEGRTRVLAVTEIDVSGLRTEEKAGRRLGHLELRLEAIPRDGGETRVHTVAMDADVPAAAALHGGGAWRPIRLDFELPSGVYRVRASVRDAASGASGVVAQRVELGDPSAFRISTPILSDVAAAASGASAAREPAALAHQQFATGSGRPLLCQFEVFGAARHPATKRADVALRLSLADGQGKALGGSAVPMTQSRDGRLRQLIALPLEDLAPGRYALSLVVEDRIAGAKEEWRDAFVVEAPTAAASESLPPGGRTATAQATAQD